MQNNKETQAQQNHKGFTQRILNIDWSEHFPPVLSKQDSPDTEEVRLSDQETVRNFMLQNGDYIFEKCQWQTQFLSEEYSMGKFNYYDGVGDFFAFHAQNKIVGTFVGNVSDWSTYYLRSCAILPEFQGRGYFSKFLMKLFSVLSDNGINRAETEVSPSNIGEIYLFNKLNFNITGYRTSERWGTSIHFTKFLNASHEKSFLDRFCDGVRPQLNQRPTQ